MARNENNQRQLKGYYGFQKKYPSRRGERPIHESRKAKKRERIRTILFCVFLCCLFSGVFIFAKFCYNLSTRPLDNNVIEEAPVITADNLGTVRATYLPNDILDDVGKLNDFLKTAKDNGFNSVMLDFKTQEGVLTYHSDLMKYSGSENIVEIDSSILERIKLKGFLILGRVYCFEDTIAPQRLNAYVYENVEKTRIWFDDSAITGGRVWLDPTSSKATNYITSVIKEVTSLGVDCIYLDSVQFPESRTGAVPVYTEDDTSLNRNLILMNFVEKAVKSANGRPVILGFPLECAEGGNTEKWGGTLFDTSAHICSPLLESPGNSDFISFIENSYLVYNDKAQNNFSTVKVIPTIKNPIENQEFYEKIASSRAESYIIIP
jgi:hypothetical protein